MDLKLIGSVLGGHKRLMLGGVVLGGVLAIMSYGQPRISHGSPTIVPRGAETWQTQSQLLITQQNDPYGDVVQGLPLTRGKSTSQSPPLEVGGVGYMTSLAPVYAAIANGDLVQRQVREIAPTASVAATPVVDPTSGAPLPVVQLTVTAATRALAMKLAHFAASALERYVVHQQAVARVPAIQRVQLSSVQSGFQVKLVKGHKPTVPLLVFIAVMAAAISLAFVLENAHNTGPGEEQELADGSDYELPQRASGAAGRHRAGSHHGEWPAGTVR